MIVNYYDDKVFISIFYFNSEFKVVEEKFVLLFFNF